MDSETARVSTAASKMWVISFFNTAMVLLILNARLPDTSKIKELLDFLPEDSPVFNGAYYDFNAEWYGVVGVSIGATCFIQAISPLFNFLFCLRYSCKRWYDRKFT